MQSTTGSGRQWLLSTAFAAVVLLVSEGVQAAELNTAVLRSNGSTLVDYRCQLSNLGTDSASVTLTVLNTSGTVVNVPFEVAVAPGATTQSIVPGTSASGARCRASGKFPKKKVAMTLQLFATATGITEVVVPGQ